jgi:hypothetical protein
MAYLDMYTPHHDIYVLLGHSGMSACHVAESAPLSTSCGVADFASKIGPHSIVAVGKYVARNPGHISQIEGCGCIHIKTADCFVNSANVSRMLELYLQPQFRDAVDVELLAEVLQAHT